MKETSLRVAGVVDQEDKSTVVWNEGGAQRLLMEEFAFSMGVPHVNAWKCGKGDP